MHCNVFPKVSLFISAYILHLFVFLFHNNGLKFYGLANSNNGRWMIDIRFLFWMLCTRGQSVSIEQGYCSFLLLDWFIWRQLNNQIGHHLDTWCLVYFQCSLWYALGERCVTAWLCLCVLFCISMCKTFFIESLDEFWFGILYYGWRSLVVQVTLLATYLLLGYSASHFLFLLMFVLFSFPEPKEKPVYSFSALLL